MKIGIIGAGIAGLATAKTLKEFGHEITVFEKEPDVGGVWASSRRYAGLTTQNVVSTYAFSDFPFPDDYPEFPSGEQVQRYLDAYAQRFGLYAHIQLNTEVSSAKPGADDASWWISLLDRSTGEQRAERFDYVVVCNGTFSEPFVPSFEGEQKFTVAGGIIRHTNGMSDVASLQGKHVLIVGYGRSACDVAKAVSAHAATTLVVARHVIWKVPKRLLNVLNYKFLLLTRFGEALFRYVRLRGFERFLHGPGRFLRNALLAQMGWVISKQCKLQRLNLQPNERFESVARSTVSLVSDGFFAAVEAGTIRVERGAEIHRLNISGRGPSAQLTSGEVVPADVVICGTGWTQNVAFLSSDVMAKVTDNDGNFRLFRGVKPIGVPNLLFNGYNSSLFCQLNSEMGALWIADFIGGRMRLPDESAQLAEVDERLVWMNARTNGKHAKGTNIIPFSLHVIDEMLADMSLRLGAWKRLKQWLLPLTPSDFAGFLRELRTRYEKAAAVPRETTEVETANS